MYFQNTAVIQMKHDIRGINTYGIKRSVINKHRDTRFRVRDYYVCENGDEILRVYGVGNGNELRMAILNPNMFELVKERSEL
jgi:hypothetical protein